MSKNKYSYSDVARGLDLPERTIRHWVTEGLIRYPELSKGRLKYFSEDQAKEISALKRLLKDFGLSFDDVRSLKDRVCTDIDHLTSAKKYPLSILISAIDNAPHKEPEKVKKILNDLVWGLLRLKAKKSGGFWIVDTAKFLNSYEEEGFSIFRNVGHIDTRSNMIGTFYRLSELEKYFQRKYDRFKKGLSGVDNSSERVKKEADLIRGLIKAEVMYQPHYKYRGEFYLTPDDIKLSESWSVLFSDLKQRDFSLLLKLKKTIEKNIIERFPYALYQEPFWSAGTEKEILMARFNMETEVVEKVLGRIILEINLLNDEFYPDRNPSLAFIEHYIEGFYFVFPDYLRIHSSNEMLLKYPILVKTPIHELNSMQLKNSEKLGLYSSVEVAEETERRIKQHGEDVKFLRYKVLKNLRRRKIL